MDERDFAELISVFLKGSEQNKPGEQKNEEINAAENDQQQPASEAEIRKNIIEALAEKIKESQAPEITEAAVVETAAVQPQTQSETPETKEAGRVAEETTEVLAEETILPEEIVTEEEVEQLLSVKEIDESIPLQRVLNRFLQQDGIMAALLVTRDGFTVDYVASIEVDLDMVSAVVATGFSHMARIGEELRHGDLQITMLEYESGPIVIAPLTYDVYLVVVASQWATLGRIRLEIKKQTDDLLANL